MRKIFIAFSKEDAAGANVPAQDTAVENTAEISKQAPTIEEQIKAVQLELDEANKSKTVLESAKMKVLPVITEAIQRAEKTLAALLDKQKTEATRLLVEKSLLATQPAIMKTVNNGQSVTLIITASKDAEGNETFLVTAKGAKVVTNTNNGKVSTEAGADKVRVNGVGYTSAAEACRAHGIEVGAASAVQVLKSKGAKAGLTIEWLS